MQLNVWREEDDFTVIFVKILPCWLVVFSADWFTRVKTMKFISVMIIIDIMAEGVHTDIVHTQHDDFWVFM